MQRMGDILRRSDRTIKRILLMELGSIRISTECICDLTQIDASAERRDPQCKVSSMHSDKWRVERSLEVLRHAIPDKRQVVGRR